MGISAYDRITKKRIQGAKQAETAYCDSAALKLDVCACWICPDSLKRCSASSVGISLSWYQFALFGVRSFDGQLIRLELVWFKWAYFHSGRVWRKWAQQIKLDKIGQCVFVYGKQAQTKQNYREKGIANKSFKVWYFSFFALVWI